MRAIFNVYQKSFALLNLLILIFFFLIIKSGNAQSIDAAIEWGNGKVYLFKGAEYVRFDIKADRVDDGYPKRINDETWPGITWNNGIDAAVNWGNGKVYLFMGAEYVRFDIKANRVDDGYPKKIDNETWPGIPWNNGIDAAVNWGNGKVFLFKGAEYVRFDIKADRVDDGYPKKINSETWPGITWNNGIDAAVNWGNGKVYLFKGAEYVRFDIKADRVDDGYPKRINDETWPGISSLIY